MSHLEKAIEIRQTVAWILNSLLTTAKFAVITWPNNFKVIICKSLKGFCFANPNFKNYYLLSRFFVFRFRFVSKSVFYIAPLTSAEVRHTVLCKQNNFSFNSGHELANKQINKWDEFALKCEYNVAPNALMKPDKLCGCDLYNNHQMNLLSILQLIPQFKKLIVYLSGLRLTQT